MSGSQFIHARTYLYVLTTESYLLWLTGLLLDYHCVQSMMGGHTLITKIRKRDIALPLMIKMFESV